MITGFSVFRKPSYDLLEHVAHLVSVYGFGIQVQFRELFNHAKEPVVFIQIGNLLLKLQPSNQHILDVRRKGLQVEVEVLYDGRSLVQKPCEIVIGSVVERVSGKTLQNLLGRFRILLVSLGDFLLAGFAACILRGESALEASDYNHRNDDVLIFVGLVGATQSVGNGKNHVNFFIHIQGGIVHHNLSNFRFCHFSSPPVIFR